MLDTTTSTVQYRGGGGESVFPLPFPFQEKSHIHAHVTDSGPVGDNGNAARTLTAGVDFIVNRFDGTGGELVLLGDAASALPADAVLTIRRLLPLTQEIFFHNQGPNSPRAIEEAIDKLTMIAQQLLAEIEGDGAGRIEALESALEEKAPLAHSHATGDIPGLADSLAGKADAAATAQALAKKAEITAMNQALAAKADKAELALKADAGLLALKADSSALAGKADAAHTHGMSGVSGLAAALALKLDADDPRLDAVGGGVTDHALLENRGAANQHPQSAIANLSADLAAIRDSLAALAGVDETLFGTLGGKTDTTVFLNAKAGLESSLAALSGRMGAAESEATAAGAAAGALGGRMTSAEAGLSLLETETGTLGGRLDSLGPLAHAPDAPADGKLYLRRDGAWVEAPETPVPPPGGTGGGAVIGDIRLLPFRPDALPAGWHFCNGAAVALSSPQGQVLSALPESYKADWGITVTEEAITLPNLFDPETGGGLFPRAVDGAARLPGSVQTDAIRNITGRFSITASAGPVLSNPSGGTPSQLEGAFTTQNPSVRSYGPVTDVYGSRSTGDLMLDASLAVPTAEENRPVNVGMTPAVHLGV